MSRQARALAEAVTQAVRDFVRDTAAAMLADLLQAAGIKLDDPLLSEIEGYDEFPKYEEWIAQTRKKILKGEGR